MIRLILSQNTKFYLDAKNTRTPKGTTYDYYSSTNSEITRLEERNGVDF
jgi:hypothetical protein